MEGDRMSLVATQPVPLSRDADGVIRVGGTRVTLDTVVAAYRDGLTVDETVHQYPSLGLADVYLAIGYYLNHREEMDAYLQDRQQFAAEVRRENEHRFDPAGIRDRLLARRRQG
jgi:uncharacterized protein (DUF433 family)